VLLSCHIAKFSSFATIRYVLQPLKMCKRPDRNGTRLNFALYRALTIQYPEEEFAGPGSEEEYLMTESTKKTTTRRKTSASASGPRATADKRKAAASKVTAINVSHEEIARLAHRFWAERGGQHGHDAEDWLRAEQELLRKAS
jgi:Protein of unknown function (DUF2934)